MGLLWAILVLIVSFAFPQDVLKLGAAVSFSGKYAKEGELLKKGYELWKDTVNRKEGGDLLRRDRL